ncbi:MAG: NUDIX domain-containing protein [Candidatus Promineofilum sp.]|nr:NUDIX domain-containing protein [Promineifilum sp.]
MARSEFQTPAELAAWLAAKGIDTSGWGVVASKGLADLWSEYTSGEATFQDEPPLRLIEVAETIIRRGDTVLIELEQEFDDGRRRARLVPPSEKMKPGEDPRVTALRCLREELGLAEGDVVMGESYVTSEGIADAPSYPGLSTRYIFHTFEATADGLPDEDFYLENTATGDPVRRHLWGWRER